MPDMLLKGKQIDCQSLIDRLAECGFTATAELPIYCVEVGEERTIPNCVENTVHFSFTNCGKLTNCGRLIIRD